jgi:hypothetical protein
MSHYPKNLAQKIRRAYFFLYMQTEDKYKKAEISLRITEMVRNLQEHDGTTHRTLDS